MCQQRNFFTFFVILFSLQCAQADDAVTFHPQLNDQVLKNIHIENPSETDQDHINLARAFQDFGTKQELMLPENWHALLSVNMFTQILPKYNRTQTLFGYRMLQQQCSAGLTDNYTTLNHRQEIIKFLEQNQEIVTNLSKIFESAIQSEKKFLELFKITDETIKSLYFSSKCFEKFNENSVAMEASTRLQSTLPMAFQILDWLAVPIVINYLQDTSGNKIPYKIGNAMYTALKNIQNSPQQQIYFFEKCYGTSHTTAISLTSLLAAIKIYALYNTIQATKVLFDTIYTKQQELITFR